LDVWGFLLFSFFFKVNSGVFLHNRVATLVVYCIVLWKVLTLPTLTLYMVLRMW